MKNVYIGKSPMQNRTNSRTPCLVHPNHIWMFPLHNIAIKVPKCTKYEVKLVTSSYFLFVSNILSFPSSICVDKRD